MSKCYIHQKARDVPGRILIVTNADFESTLEVIDSIKLSHIQAHSVLFRVKIFFAGSRFI